MEYLNLIHEAILKGNAAATQEGVKTALSNGIPAETILNQGLIVAMNEVGQLFEEKEYFVPEMLVAARAMQSGLAVLKPHLVASGVPSAGCVVIGTVKGDLHDIGKNLVAMMLEGGGFSVVDLGTDVPPAKFVEAVQQHRPHVVGLSALLTTTMAGMEGTIHALKEAGVRDQVKVIVGGAPVTDNFAKRIGADGYSPDASATVRMVKSLLSA